MNHSYQLTLHQTMAEEEEDDVGSKAADDQANREDETPAHCCCTCTEAIAQRCSKGSLKHKSLSAKSTNKGVNQRSKYACHTGTTTKT